MKIRPIQTEAEYEEALEEIAHYFESEPPSGTPAAERFDRLARFIEVYEDARWPIDLPAQPPS